MNSINPPKTRTASKVTLLLIQEELKNRKLFDDLHLINYHNAFYRSNLIDIIMLAMGLKPESSLQRSTCQVLLDRHSQRVVADARELMDEAQRVYDIFAVHAAVYNRQSESPRSTVHGPQL
jgi:hypothetical protein